MLSLKNIKYAAFKSEETQCFEAALYYKGKKCAIAKNDGHGGCTDFYPLDDALFQDAVCYAKAMPAKETSIKNQDGSNWLMEMDLEAAVNELLEDYLAGKELKKLLAKRVLWTTKGNPGIYQTQAAKSAADRDIWVEQIAKKDDVDQILNTLPADKALKLFRERT